MRKIRGTQRARILNNSLPGTPVLEGIIHTESHHRWTSLATVQDDHNYTGTWYIGDKWAVPDYESDDLFLESLCGITDSLGIRYADNSVVADVLSCIPGANASVYCEMLDIVAPLPIVIINLNDDLKMKREEIADWLDTLSVDLKLRKDLYEHPNARLLRTC
jgi:hypothetical protein